MNKNKLILILLGLGITMLFLVSYLESNSPFDIFNISIGVIIILLGFYNENKKISYLLALFCVNIVQWLILIYIYYYNQIYVKTEFYYYLVGALLFTIALINQIYKNHLKSPENNQKTKNSIDKTKIIMLFTGLIIIIGCLAGFIVYLSPIFLYGITLGLMALIAGFYREDNKTNFSSNYVKVMASVFILQWFIIAYSTFTRQFSGDDFVNALTISLVITIYFLVQLSTNNIRIIKIFK